MIPFTKIKKTKKTRMLVLSTGGPQSGMQCLYISAKGDTWEILSHAVFPYPDQLAKEIELISHKPEVPVMLGHFASIDQKMTYFMLDCSRSLLSNAQKVNKQPHLIVVNKCSILQLAVSDINQAKQWDISCGDVQLLSSTFNVPVVSDFQRHSVLAGQVGQLPLFPGNVKLSRQQEPVSLYLDIGMISHITAVDNQAITTIVDSDIGPGTSLINTAAKDAGCKDGFDRDGSYAAQGKICNDCVESLAARPWFLLPPPKRVNTFDFTHFYEDPAIQQLSPFDRIATLTALTARTCHEFYKREFRHAVKPETVWVAGGGANNLSLLSYLATYFDPIKVKSIEDCGIPSAFRIPLALGLTVYEYITIPSGSWKAGMSPEIRGIGRWVFPE
jgi:anhydro-N-acetylmuramic acid kinase